MSATADSPEIAELRAKLFDGITPLRNLALAQNCTLRTMQTYVAEGMPCVWIGPSPYPIVDEAIPWIRNRRRRKLAARRPGRPPNKAA
jgi:hypothetical protein